MHEFANLARTALTCATAAAFAVAMGFPGPGWSNPLDQDHLLDESGPHFFDNACCFCKEAKSITQTEDGYLFSLFDGRDMFVEPHMVRPSPTAEQWYCPSIAGSKRCGLMFFGS